MPFSNGKTLFVSVAQWAMNVLIFGLNDFTVKFPSN